MRTKSPLLAVLLGVSSCVPPPAAGNHAAPVRKWQSAHISISLIPDDESDSNGSLHYAVRFDDGQKAACFPSQISREYVDEAFSNPNPAEFKSAVVFSPEGEYAVIQDISPGSASGDVDFYLLNRNSPKTVLRLEVLTRPAPLIPLTPLIVGIDSKKAALLFEGDSQPVTVELSSLLSTAVPVDLSNHPNL